MAIKVKIMKPKIRCPNCGSSQAWIRIKTGQIVCPECGTITPKKGQFETGKNNALQV